MGFLSKIFSRKKDPQIDPKSSEREERESFFLVDEKTNGLKVNQEVALKSYRRAIATIEKMSGQASAQKQSKS